jgi:hypothetical protein
MGRTCSTYEADEKMLIPKLKERNHMRDLRVDGNV